MPFVDMLACLSVKSMTPREAPSPAATAESFLSSVRELRAAASRGG